MGERSPWLTKYCCGLSNIAFFVFFLRVGTIPPPDYTQGNLEDNGLCPGKE
jgi:hypothetical protein